MNSKRTNIFKRMVIVLMVLFWAAPAAQSATTTVNYQVSASADDAWRGSSGGNPIHRTYLRVGNYISGNPPIVMSAMRFTNVDIPKDSIVTDARLQIRTTGNYLTDVIYGVIHAEQADSPPDFNSRSLLGIVRTVAEINWDHSDSWSANTWYNSPDISSAVQEVIDRPGWLAGNAMVITYSNRKKEQQDRFRDFYAYDYASSSAPILQITYSESRKISGHVKTSQEIAVEGVLVSADNDGRYDVTDSNGYYELMVPKGWSGTVTPSKEEYGFTPNNRLYNNVNSNKSDQDFIGIKPKISGYVRDRNNAGVESVNVSADNGGESVITATNGYYELSVPYNWSGTVTVSKAGWDIAPSSQSYSNVVSDQINQDYAAFQPRISGYVHDVNGADLEGVSVSADNGGGSDTTDIAGYYEITIPYNWTGVVTPYKTGCLFNPSKFSYESVTTDQFNQDYTVRLHPYAGGSGIAEDPILIADANHMQAIGVHPEDWDKHFLLTNDINLAIYNGENGHQTFNLIGGEFVWAQARYVGVGFSGVFDGNEHVIYNLKLNMPSTNCVGLFRSLEGAGAQIKNVGIYEPNIIANSLVGCITGIASENTLISNCWVDNGSITGSGRIGGIVGYNTFGAEITDCHVENIKINGGSTIGGIVGFNTESSYISRCYSTGEIFGSGTLGGFSGHTRESFIEQCFSEVDVYGNGDKIGGFTGGNADYGDIFDCYASGDVSGADFVGGFVGYKSNTAAAQISRCYAVGRIVGSGDNVGGIAGKYMPYCYLGTNNFFDVETTGITTECGGVGKTTSLMHQMNTYTSAGWNFSSIWTICNGMNYPKLLWQIPPLGDFICPDGVDFIDFSILASAWLSSSGEIDWDPDCDISDPNDDVIDELDLMVFCENWLVGVE